MYERKFLDQITHMCCNLHSVCIFRGLSTQACNSCHSLKINPQGVWPQWLCREGKRQGLKRVNSGLSDIWPEMIGWDSSSCYQVFSILLNILSDSLPKKNNNVCLIVKRSHFIAFPIPCQRIEQSVPAGKVSNFPLEDVSLSQQNPLYKRAERWAKYLNCTSQPFHNLP